MKEKTTDQLIKEIHAKLIPEKKPIPELISQDEIAKLYGKSNYWFANLKVRKKLKFTVHISVSNHKIYSSKEVIETLKQYGYEPER